MKNKMNIVKAILVYFNRHNHQATIIVAALSLGFLIAVSFVGYVFAIQSRHGCLTFFLTKFIEQTNEGTN